MLPASVQTWHTAQEEHYSKEPRLKATVFCSFSATTPRQDGGIVAVGILSVSHKAKCLSNGVISASQQHLCLFHSPVAMVFRAQLRQILHILKLHLAG